MNTFILPDYKIGTCISEGCNTIVYRGIRESDGQPVIIKILKAEFPTLEQITRLKNEYKITQHLEVESIVKSYSLETYQNRLALILEDFGGCALSQIMSKTKKLNLTEFLNIGIQLASALNSLHQNSIIHKDIKPSNIIINPRTGTVKITDFSVASQLSKENTQVNSANLVEGTVAYMSPEQTGRMNRTLDYRSDFYSLGVTFYEMLTGELPFNSSDILELVHCHIAKHPVPPCELVNYAENGCEIPPWKEHLRETVPTLQEGFHSGLEVGNLIYAGYCAFNHCNSLFFTGENLEVVEQKQAGYINLLRQLKTDYVASNISVWRQTSLNLLGLAADKCRLIGEAFDESTIPEWEAINDGWVLFTVHFIKSMLFYLFKEFNSAVDSAALSTKYLLSVGGWSPIAAQNFYYSLALLAAYPTADSEAREKYLMQVAANQEKMQKWAHHAPMNYQHKYDLVEAEKARIFGKDWEAADYYDKAIEGAKEQGYIQEEALANELAAEFYFSRKKDKIARVYLTESYYGYIRWGAIAKVKDLEVRYPQLVAQTLNRETKPRDLTVTATTTTTNSDFSKILDINTLIKASQAITSEIVLDKLLARSIVILLENAAAQKAVLMLYKDANLLVQAVGTAEQKQAAVLQSIPVDSSQELPVSLINYVSRTQTDLVVNNADSERLFAEDPYIISHQPKSILCIPVIFLSKIMGIIYLENKATACAFLPERLQVLKVLTSQVAIALENARLYAQEQEKSQQLAQSLHKLQQTQAQLVQTEKISSLGQLVAGVAHEVNNPVGFISGNLHHANDYVQDLICTLNLYQQHYPNPVPAIAEAAEDMELDYIMEDLPKMLGSMQLGIDRIRDIMQSLRNFSRVDGIEKKPADIHAGIETTLMILQHRLKAKPERPAIQVIKEYGDLPAVECYSGQLNQVFMNLLSNAIDALDEFNADRTYAEIEKHPNIITICTELKEEGIRNKEEMKEEIKRAGTGVKFDTFAVIRIKDNGPGMAEATRCKLFDPFFTTKPEGKGTGLGLSISYQIVVEKHGGALECISEPGKGAEFAIAIPLIK